MADEIMMSDTLQGLVDFDSTEPLPPVMMLSLAFDDKHVFVSLLTHFRFDVSGKIEFELNCETEKAAEELVRFITNGGRKVMYIEIDKGTQNLVRIIDVYVIDGMYMNEFNIDSSRTLLGINLKKHVPAVL